MPKIPFDRQYAGIDAAIAGAEATAAKAASERKTEHGRLSGLLGSGQDREARAIQQRMRELEDSIELAEQKVIGLRAKREEIVAAEAAEKAEAKAAIVGNLAADREALALAVESAVSTIGKGIQELEKLTREIAAEAPRLDGRPALDLSDVRNGLDHSLMAAGITWPFRGAATYALPKDRLFERISRGNAAAKSACRFETEKELAA